MLKIKKFYIYLANLNLKFGTEPGKIRPVIVVQTNLLNSKNHPSTIVCPLTTKIIKESKILRVNLAKQKKLKEDSDILIDQIRTIDNKRFIKEIGKVDLNIQKKILENLKYLILE